MIQHLQPSPGGMVGTSGVNAALSPALPEHILYRSKALLATVRQGALLTGADNAQDGLGSLAEQLRQRMRVHIADLLVDDEDDGG
jgi:hypothetical protein